MAEYILETKDLGISFGGLKAAQNVNIRIMNSGWCVSPAAILNHRNIARQYR